MANVDFPPCIQIPEQHSKRYDDLKKLFRTQFGHEASFFARAPGRVNLIGEHIDYCGYSVLPMALEQDIVVAVAINTDGTLNLHNSNNTYISHECKTTNIAIDKNNPEWYKYFLCGLKGIVEHLSLSSPVGMNCLIDGNVPKSAGLSSSSALVCCAALATLHANAETMAKRDLADLCAHSERYIGTEGGGMDQAISFLAEPGTAKKIDFNPLTATDVKLPKGAVFVISSSCVEMNKAATAHFNIRVVEDRIACQIMAKSRNLNWRKIRKLGDLQNEVSLKLEDMAVMVGDILHKEPYSKEEVQGILDVNTDELAETSLSANTLDVQTFKLHDRALHVYEEANRVLKFKSICDGNPPGVLKELGQLMSASHESCRDLYQCSCDELDELVNVCVSAGALGSRLTGAGWGGCAVSLVPGDKLDSFLENVRTNFYNLRPDRAAYITESLFVTQPGGGAAIYRC